MADHFRELQFADGGENFGEGHGRAAGRVLFHSVMHFDDFQIEPRPKNLRGFAGEPEKRVDASRVIGRNHHGDL